MVKLSSIETFPAIVAPGVSGMPTASSFHEVTIYRVDDLIMDVGRGRVTRGDTELTLTPLSFELLLALVRAAPDILSLDKLMDQVWPGMVVSGETVSQRVKLVRDALGDQAASPRYIAGVRGRGYRIVAPVSPVTDSEPTTAPPELVRSPKTLRARIFAAGLSCLVLLAGTLWWVLSKSGNDSPRTVIVRAPPQSVAVLPFENLSSDRNNTYFADGMQDMVLTKLAKIGGLKVISRTSTADFKSHPNDLKAIGQELGVATVLEGSVQKAGKRVLINVQLVDTQTQNHLWATSYTRSLDDVFGVEGDVAQKVAVALKARLDPAEQARVVAIPTHNPAAYDAYLHALSPKGNMQVSINSLRQAVKLDPDFALAWADLSDTLSSAYFNAYNRIPAYRTEAKQALDRARALAPSAAETQLAAGTYYFTVLQQYTKALAAYRKVLKAAPNNTGALAEIGIINRRQGHWQTAIDYFKRNLALNPRAGGMWFHLGWSYYGLHQYVKAEEMFRRALAIDPDDLFTIRTLATMYQSEGDLARASKILVGSKLPPNNWLLYAPVLNQALYRHRYTDAVNLLKKALKAPNLSREIRGAYYQYLGFAERLTGDSEAARHSDEQAIVTLKQAPDSPPKFGMLALAQAGLRQGDAALASGRRSMELIPATQDHFQGPIGEYFFAVVEAQVGENAQAIAMLKKLLGAPPGSNVCEFLTPALLRLNPFWDPLRRDPDFQALLARYPVTFTLPSQI